jgi:uncharacterized protein YndB with AHSA1/START domain
MSKQITEEVVVAGSPDKVWKLITDPQHFQKWYAFGGAKIDLKPGGAMELRWDEHGIYEATVDSVVIGKKFSFRWLPDPGPLVEITLRAESDHGTLVTVVESGDLEDSAMTALSWRNGLELLQNLAKVGKTGL